MSFCDNFDQLFVHRSRPKKGIQHCTDLDLSTSKKKNVNPFPIPCFHDPEVNYTEKKWEKKKLIVTTRSLFFPQCISTV